MQKAATQYVPTCKSQQKTLLMTNVRAMLDFFVSVRRFKDEVRLQVLRLVGVI